MTEENKRPSPISSYGMNNKLISEWLDNGKCRLKLDTVPLVDEIVIDNVLTLKRNADIGWRVKSRGKTSRKRQTP